MTFRCVFVCFIVYFHSNPIVMHYAASSTFYELLCRDARDESKTAVRLIATQIKMADLIVRSPFVCNVYHLRIVKC